MLQVRGTVNSEACKTQSARFRRFRSRKVWGRPIARKDIANHHIWVVLYIRVPFRVLLMKVLYCFGDLKRS